jgi:hypothetical protein
LKLSTRERSEAFDAVKWGVNELCNSKDVSKREREFYKVVLFKIGAVEQSIIAQRRIPWYKRLASWLLR